MSIKVSVCVPAYNQPELLRRVLNSIKEQSFQDYEVVITDDSTNDAVSAVASEFLADGRYRYYKNNERKGTPGNWNEAIQYAKAPLIKILHHDDWFSNNDSLEIFVKMLVENPSANFAFSSSLNFDENQHLSSKNIPSEKQLMELKNNSACLFWGNFVGAPSATIFRKHNAPKFDENLKWLVDIDFYIALLQINPVFVFSEKPLTSTTSMSDFQVSASFRQNGLLQLYEYYYLRKKLNFKIYKFPYTWNFIKLILDFLNMPISRNALFESDFVKSPCLEMRIALVLYQLNRHLKIIYKKLRSMLRSCLPLCARRLYVQHGKNAKFEKEFSELKRQESDNSFRFPSLSWQDRYPCLEDGNSNTPFDKHYLYHPAWAARVLAKIMPRRHVDISSSLSFCTIVSAFVPVDFYDYRPAMIDLDGLRSKFGDLLHLPFADGELQSVSCMHVIEHVGLGRYGDPLDYDGDLKAIAELKRITKVGGDLLLVVPVGMPKIAFNAHRIYSYEQIVENFDEFELLEFALITDPDQPEGLIRNAPPELVSQQQYGCGCFWFRRR